MYKGNIKNQNVNFSESFTRQKHLQNLVEIVSSLEGDKQRHHDQYLQNVRFNNDNGWIRVV